MSTGHQGSTCGTKIGAPSPCPIRRLIVTSRGRKICFWNSPIALKFARHFGSCAAEAPVKFQSDMTIQTTIFAASILHEVLRYRNKNTNKIQQSMHIIITYLHIKTTNSLFLYFPISIWPRWLSYCVTKLKIGQIWVLNRNHQQCSLSLVVKSGTTVYA